MRLSVSEQALDDARDTAHWYISEGAWPVALCLQEQVEEALIAITRTPGLDTPGPANTKLFPVRRFPRVAGVPGGRRYGARSRRCWAAPAAWALVGAALS